MNGQSGYTSCQLYKVQKLLQTLRMCESNESVIRWNEFLQHVKAKYTGINEKTLTLVTEYLHLQGQFNPG